MMQGDSTEGTSRRSGNPSVLLFADYIAWLHELGFRVDDEPLAKCLFDLVGYQHLLGYTVFIKNYACEGRVPLLEEVDALVEFDSAIRQIMLYAICPIERHLKARYSQIMAEAYGGLCLHNQSLFKGGRAYRSSINSIEREVALQLRSLGMRRTSFEAVSIWQGLEFTSFGTAVKLITATRSASVVSEVAASFAMNRRCLLSWLRTLALVRNACAHFNPYVIRPQIPSVPKEIYDYRGEEPTSPLYALLVIDRFLSGRVQAGFMGAKDDLYNFRCNVFDVLGDFAVAYPCLTSVLRIPGFFLDDIQRVSAFTTTRPARRLVEYGVTTLSRCA